MKKPSRYMLTHLKNKIITGKWKPVYSSIRYSGQITTKKLNLRLIAQSQRLECTVFITSNDIWKVPAESDSRIVCSVPMYFMFFKRFLTHFMIILSVIRAKKSQFLPLTLY